MSATRSSPRRPRRRSPRRPPVRLLLGVLAALLFVASCATVPITGRKQLSLIPESEMMAMSYQQYGEFLKANPASKDVAKTEMVKRVGGRLQKAVESYFAGQNLSSQLSGYQWEFNLIQSDEVNAWCMSGGKVVVYTGLLPVARDETGLAVVMGHEIAHAVARHGSERMSQELVAQMGGTALSAALQNKPQQTQQIWMTVFGAGAQFGALLPFSRAQESEADRLGLIFMAMAGYDPKGAVDFWQRMAQSAGGAKPPEFMSTHPSDETRIRNLNKLLPEAQGYYKPGR